MFENVEGIEDMDAEDLQMLAAAVQVLDELHPEKMCHFVGTIHFPGSDFSADIEYENGKHVVQYFNIT